MSDLGSDSGNDAASEHPTNQHPTNQHPTNQHPTNQHPTNQHPTNQHRAHHDMGGVPRFLCEPIDTGPHALTDFDRDVDALRGILGAKGVMSVDELRRGIEAIPEAQYHRMSYYQRWMRSITDNLLARGVITEAELAAALR